jgi:hypothetical protein
MWRWQRGIGWKGRLCLHSLSLMGKTRWCSLICCRWWTGTHGVPFQISRCGVSQFNTGDSLID